MQAGREKKKKGKKGKIVIKAFDNMHRSFMITNFMIVGVWWKLFKNYFAGKPLREASQTLGNFRVLGKSKQSYRAISSVLCFWRENRLWRRGLQGSQVDFFLPHHFHGDMCCLERTLSPSLPEGGLEASHLPCPPGHPWYPRWVPWGLCRGQALSCPRRWHGSDLSVSTPLFATRGHRSSGLGLTSSSSGKPRRSHPGTARGFSPAPHPAFGCPSFSFHLWLPLRCACSAVPTFQPAAHMRPINPMKGQAGSWEQLFGHSGSQWERFASGAEIPAVLAFGMLSL